MTPLELQGQRFHGLTVLAKGPSQNGRTRWVCRCDCGRESLVLGTFLRNGYTRACHDWDPAPTPSVELCGALLWDDSRLPCDRPAGHVSGHWWDIRGHQFARPA